MASFAGFPGHTRTGLNRFVSYELPCVAFCAGSRAARAQAVMADEDIADAPAAAEIPSLTLNVRVASANLLNPDAEEGSSSDISTFVRVSIAGPAAAWWWPAEPVEGDDDAPTGSALSEVGTGYVPSYSYAESSKPFLLADDHMSDLANSKLRVAVVVGAAASATDGVVLGTATVPLEDALFGSIEGEYELGSLAAEYEAYAGSVVNVVVEAPPALAQYTLGGRLLTLSAPQATGLPRQWLLGNSALPANEQDDAATLEDSSDILAMVSDPATNSARYTLSVEVPPGTGARARPLASVAVGVVPAAVGGDESKGGEGDESKGGEGGEGAAAEAPVRQVAISSRREGQLVYVPASDSRVSAAGADDEEGVATYMWQVEWPEVNIFLSKSAVAELKEDVANGVGLHITVSRIQCTPLEEGEPDVAGLGGVAPGLEDFLARGQLTVLVDELLVPGTQFIDVVEPLAPLEVSDAEREAAKEAAAKAAAEAEAAAAAAAKGKKGKKGKAKPKKGKEAPAAADADADAADQPPHLVAAEAKLSFSLQVNEPLVLRPPTPPPPELKPSDLIPARPAPPAGPPGVAASADFRKEVTELAHRVAQEFVAVCRQLAEDEGSIAHTTPELRRRALLRHLNEGGHYREMKEKLKRHVVRIVRERFHKTRQDDGA